MTDKVVAAVVDRFLKHVNATAHREIERAIRNAAASGRISGRETVTAAVSLLSEKLGLDITIYSKIEL
jgi:hypothetical protein